MLLKQGLERKHNMGVEEQAEANIPKGWYRVEDLTAVARVKRGDQIWLINQRRFESAVKYNSIGDQVRDKWYVIRRIPNSQSSLDKVIKAGIRKKT